MAAQVAHSDVGAYALGALDSDQTAAFEEHLAECAACAAELEQFLSISRLLSQVRLEELTPPVENPPPTVLDGLISQVATTRRHSRTRRMLALAASAAVIVGAGAIGLATWNDDSNDLGGGEHTEHTPTVALLMTGELTSATNPATGVEARLATEQRAWGTHAGLELKSIHGPLRCKLVAVSKSGAEETMFTWKIPPEGYGVPGQPKPFTMHGATSFDRGEIKEFKVVTTAGENIVTFPAA
jgi:Putative zinc-finger